MSEARIAGRPSEVVEALRAAPRDDPDLLDRVHACLAEVAPELIPHVVWIEVDGEQFLGTSANAFSHTELELLHRAYRLAGGSHDSCLDCFINQRGPLCAIGDCAGRGHRPR